ncbi:hypothetical protein PR048_024013 [Dryococelus australis]|uniref:Uncharacterized protein n=1 Tax=Dryococelus australis TaxID=614101 RepID=A0ABQ9GVR4_9NEOP|nr:hypothetical protein PR048_024013 [Dryococelus australis]
MSHSKGSIFKTIKRMYVRIRDIIKFRKISDRDFGTLERKIRKYDRVYITKEYVEMIVTSSCKRSFIVAIPYSISNLEFKQWWYLKRTMLSQESYGKSIPGDEKTSFKPNQFMHFIYASDNSGLVARPFIHSLMKHHFRILDRKLSDLVLPADTAYPAGCIPINQKKKIDDLRKLQNCTPHTEDCQSFCYEVFV